MKTNKRRRGVVLMGAGIVAVIVGFFMDFRSTLGSILVLGGFFISYMGSYAYRIPRKNGR